MKVIYDMLQIEQCARHIKDKNVAFSDDSIRQINNVILKEVTDLSLGNYNPWFVKYGLVFSCDLSQVEYENVLTVSVMPEEEIDYEQGVDTHD